MKHWIKRSLITLAGVTVVLGSLTACGDRSERQHGQWSDERVAEVRGKAVTRISNKLELDAAQKQKLELLADEALAARKAMRASSGDPRQELGSIIAGDKFDRSKAQQWVGKNTDTLQQQSPKLIEAMGNFYDSLNADQQKQVRAMLDKRKGWFRG
jgi:periplasmic protein CpxP/Spy